MKKDRGSAAALQGAQSTPSRRDFLKGAAIIAAAGVGLPLSARRTKAFVQPSEASREGLFAAHGVAVAPSGTVFVADSGNYRVRIYSADLRPIGEFGRPGFGPGRLNYPTGVDIAPDGLVYVADANNGRICRFRQDGGFVDEIGSLGGAVGCFFTPQAVRVGPDGTIYVVNTRGHNVQVLEPGGKGVRAVWGILGDDPPTLSPGDLLYTFRLPTDCAVLAGGKLWVLDSKHGAIKRLTADGGYEGLVTNTDPPVTLNRPQAMVLVRRTLYVCDTGNGRIGAFDLDAGRADFIQRPELREPTGIAVDGNGRLFVADAQSPTLHVIEARG